MQITNEELGKHYASLSDGELEDIDPADLTEAARKVYELEMKKRHLAEAVPSPEPAPDPEAEIDGELEPEEEPDWLEKAVCVCSFQDGHHTSVARDALLAARVPCHVSIAPEGQSFDQYQVMVPPGLHLKGKTVLDRQIFNLEAEDGVRTHLAALSDEEFQALTVDDICGGEQDMLDRLKQVYADEVARRSAYDGR